MIHYHDSSSEDNSISHFNIQTLTTDSAIVFNDFRVLLRLYGSILFEDVFIDIDISYYEKNSLKIHYDYGLWKYKGKIKIRRFSLFFKKNTISVFFKKKGNMVCY